MTKPGETETPPRPATRTLSDYWDLVGECLVEFHSFRRDEAARACQELRTRFCHSEPFNVACDIADVQLSPAKFQDRYESLQKYLTGRSELVDAAIEESRLNRVENLPGRGGKKRSNEAKVLSHSERQKKELRSLHRLSVQKLKKFYERANRKLGVARKIAFQTLETRLDNIVYLLGFTLSRVGARKMITHGHILVNGRKVTVASYSCKVDDTVELKKGANSIKLATDALESAREAPEWLEFDRKALKARLIRLPLREDMRIQTRANVSVKLK